MYETLKSQMLYWISLTNIHVVGRNESFFTVTAEAILI